jgi:ABC-type multidrug transport system fused ATPase/permease subunit
MQPLVVSEQDLAKVQPYLDDVGTRTPISQRHVRSFIRTCLAHYFLLFGSVALLGLSIGATLLSPRIVGFIVDQGFLKKDRSALYFWMGAFFVMEVVRILSNAAQSYYFIALGERVMHDIRYALFSHLIRLPFKIVDGIPLGNLVSRLTNDVKVLAELLQSGIVQVMKDFLTVVVILFAMFFVEWRLSCIALIGLPVTLWLSQRLVRSLFELHRAGRRILTGFTALLSDTIAGAEVIRLFNKSEEFARRARTLVDNAALITFKRIRVNSVFHPMVTLLNGLGIALLLVYGSVLVQRGEVKVGQVITLVTYMQWILWPLVQVVNRFEVFLSGLAALERIYEALDWETETEGEQESRAKMTEVAEIRFENVWFAYANEEWVLKDFSLTIGAGERIGIVGPTGSGKSTLVSLLLRFCDPQRGRILIGGIDIRKFSKKELRSYIGYMQQDARLFSGTIRDNITLWDRSPKPILNDIVHDSSFVQLGDYERVISQEGAELSEGEKQLVAFARSVYSEPFLWILDEATAHVDPLLDEQLGALVRKFARGRTTITIAHRLPTVRDSDRIVVLLNGGIRESGTHEQLMAHGGMYSRMYQLQEV